jgi:hypothetical protein
MQENFELRKKVRKLVLYQFSKVIGDLVGWGATALSPFEDK